MLLSAPAALLTSCSSAHVAKPAPLDVRSATVAVAQDPSASFAGAWDTTYGRMVLSRAGSRLAGTYGPNGTESTIEGELRGARFAFTYREPRAHGEGWLELADGGAAFRGKWREDGSTDWSAWEGTRSAAASAESGFGGVWQTTYGVMRLALDDAHAHGTYTYSSGSKIEGDVAGRVLRATYSEPDGTRGLAVFELSEDGSRFRGVWRPGVDRPLELDDRGARPWTGTRVVPVAGRVWLVILEAHWEGSLADHEYSYGAMLRSFFERLPQVEVRHRFFHDRDDFVRFCGELQALVEPVVLYVSSHGTRKGIAVGGEVIDGATMGAALRGLDNLSLLHLGACETLGGDFASQVRSAAATARPFPISGFTVPVDWAGSAIVDFTYLDMVLERGLAPEKAVEAVRSMLTFAGPPGRADDAIPGTNLTIVGAKDAP
ncbi:MAG TPA: hypothetical protein VKE69_01945 [Planctomycetota bacterium]|nr:hypothetical protein [Planctomycetota bacterium]